MVGAPFAAVLSDRFGRRKGMFAGAVVILVGMILTTTSKTLAQVCVCFADNVIACADIDSPRSSLDEWFSVRVLRS